MPHDLPSHNLQAENVAWEVLPEGSHQFSLHDGPTGRVFPCSATASVELPLSVATMFVVALGSAHWGVCDIDVQDSDEQHPDAVFVGVKTYHTHWYASNLPQLRKEQPSVGVRGLRIETPDEYRNGEELFIRIEIRFPTVATAAQHLHISSFETDLPQFSHRIGDLAQIVDFGSLLLRGTNGQITSQSIYAKSLSLNTSNAGIHGQFTCSHTLTLRSSNGTIDAAVFRDDLDRDEPSTIIMETSNGAITSRIVLPHSAANGATGDNHLLTARTSNAPIHMKVPRIPLQARILVEARSTNSSLLVELTEAFEGEFRINTSNSRPAIRHNPHAVDPSGRGQQRVVHSSNNGWGTVTGIATWGAPTPGRAVGSVNLQTSNAPATIVLREMHSQADE